MDDLAAAAEALEHMVPTRSQQDSGFCAATMRSRCVASRRSYPLDGYASMVVQGTKSHGIGTVSSDVIIACALTVQSAVRIDEESEPFCHSTTKVNHEGQPRRSTTKGMFR